MLTSDPDSALHVSLAGGRKTMRFFAGYALSLFAFDRNRGPHVHEAIPSVLERFGDRLSDWGIAAWFIAGNS
jgi:CRISPR-associated protein (TIGR02584 family)